MLAKFLNRITTKIRRFWHAKERARFLTGFLVADRVVVAVGMLRVEQNKTCHLMSGCSTGYCGQIAAAQYYPPFGIHR